ncbi:hypothetical protein D9M72_385050 [compost metagenome]
MTVGIALGGHDRHATFLVDTQEAVRAGNRLQGVDRHGQAAVGAVLEADGRGQTGGHFTVSLGFGGARADGRPADQVLQVLRGDRVECFGSGGQAHFRQVEQQLAADVQAVLDLEGVVEVRVVDQAFPADGGARLLEVHAHHQEEGIGQLGSQALQAVGVLVSGLDVVDGAGAHDHEQAMVLAIEDIAYHLATVGDGAQGCIGQGNFALQLLRRDQGLVGGNVKVVDL